MKKRYWGRGRSGFYYDSLLSASLHGGLIIFSRDTNIRLGVTFTSAEIDKGVEVIPR